MREFVFRNEQIYFFFDCFDNAEVWQHNALK